MDDGCQPSRPNLPSGLHVHSTTRLHTGTLAVSAAVVPVSWQKQRHTCAPWCPGSKPEIGSDGRTAEEQTKHAACNLHCKDALQQLCLAEWTYSRCAAGISCSKTTGIRCNKRPCSAWSFQDLQALGPRQQSAGLLCPGVGPLSHLQLTSGGPWKVSTRFEYSRLCQQVPFTL